MTLVYTIGDRLLNQSMLGLLRSEKTKKGGMLMPNLKNAWYLILDSISREEAAYTVDLTPLLEYSKGSCRPEFAVI